jgi:hypothetical protein
VENAVRTGFLGISHARWTAYVAVFGLCGVVAWNVLGNQAVPAPTANASASGQQQLEDHLGLLSEQIAAANSDGITPLGASVFSQAIIAYDKAMQTASSTQAALDAVQNFGATVRPPVDYRTYASSDVTTVSDTSKDRVLNYRADLRIALEPLLENKHNELELFAQYVDTKDTQYLKDLRAASANYKRAILNTEKVVAPADAASYQAAILTALSEFAATLDALVENAPDPFASAALLHSYLAAQDNMLASFDLIGKYSANKMI